MNADLARISQASAVMRKRIAEPGDLAVNGAPPLFDSPLQVGKPNVAGRARFMQLVEAMLDRAWLSNNGPLVQELELRIEEMLGVRHCICLNNATIGLSMAARALGLSGEVILPSYTFIATPHALEWVGLTPVFVDIDPVTHNLDPQAVRAAITPRTSGILAVHLWSRPAPVADLQAIADEHGLKLFFDAAHAFGVNRHKLEVGQLISQQASPG